MNGTAAIATSDSRVVKSANKSIVRSGVEVVTRDELPAMHTVMEGGKERVLGILKEFRRHDRMRAFLPKDFKVSIAWVHLDAGQTLEAHVHPVDSMILVAKGQVLAFGERTANLNEGDILLVPHGCEHGFTGAGTDGFWGLSVQFNSRGLYEDEHDPWATFIEPTPAVDPDGGGNAVDRLLSDNERFLANFAKHRLFSMAKNGVLSNDVTRARFLDCFQVWSNHFQKMLLARSALTDQAPYRKVAELHLADELGHNVLLEKSRPSGRSIWDPNLEAACAWFPWKTATLDDAERVVLIHLVVEASAVVFYQQMHHVLATPESAAHQAAHRDQRDEEHVQMGVAALRDAGGLDLDRLARVQRQGWDMLNHVMGRMADLVAA